MKIGTGIKGLDEVTNGGLVENSIVLLSGSGGAGKTILASQFLLNNAEESGEKGLFITMPSFCACSISRSGFNKRKLKSGLICW